jgi:two-component system, cell cycle response regulator DivK
MTTILIVEDNLDNRDMLARRLQRKGYRVELATNGDEGLSVAQRVRPDLILMDLSMPVLDGWEATRRLKSDPMLNAIPVVALTGHAMKDDRSRALAVGANDYMAKPIDFPALLTKMEYWLTAAR